LGAKVQAKYKKFLFFVWKVIFIIILNRFAIMFISSIKKLFFLFLMVLFAFSVKAQQVHFIYLQTDNGQPFYAKWNNKLVSSTAEGYIILPNITDGLYSLVVGFPKNEFPEKTYTVLVDKNNEGFLLKNFDDKGWQLFNLQTLAFIQGTTDKPVAVAVNKDEDSFTTMLAGVVKDSSILQNHEITTAPPKPVDTVTKVDSTKLAVIPKTDSTTVTAVNKTIEPAVPKADSATLNNTAPATSGEVNSTLSKILSQQDNNGLQMIYVDKTDSSSDTVRIFMPVEKDQTINNTEPKGVSESKNSNISSSADTSQLTITPTPVTPQIIDTTTSANVTAPVNDTDTQKKSLIINKTDTSQNVTPSSESDSLGKIRNSTDVNSIVNSTTEQAVPQNKVFKDSSSSQSNSGVITDVKITNVPPANGNPDTQNSKADNNNAEGQMTVLPKEVSASKVNSDCKDFATNDDFFKLRKKMAAESDMDNMLKIAKKYFKLKCYSTEQIKDLSFLFLTDEGKYKFFDAAYAFTSDSDQYQILQSQFTDPYYLNRFKAMIRKY